MDKKDFEIWKDIPRYPGYQASNLGRIRTHNKITYTELHGERHWKDRVLKFKPSAPKGIGYRISLWKDGKSKDYLVARLIATTFLEDLIETNMTVNHKDGNRLNNNIDNLEWLSREDNIKEGFRTGLYKSIEKSCILKDLSDFNEYYFNSLSAANRFLKRNHSYISHKSNGKVVTSLDGEKYKVIIRSN